MKRDELRKKLDELRELPGETEWVEFKHNNSDPDEIGANLSAISNSVALCRKDAGYIVWGIENATHKVLGTVFKPRQQKVRNEELENWLLRLLLPRIDFVIHEFDYDGQPVVLFEIPPPHSRPVQFHGERSIRVGSYTKKLKDFPEKERKLWQILSEQEQDWSKQICEAATHDDLDPTAVRFAREQYKKKHPNLATETDGWDDPTFLSKAKVCISSQITNTALLLLGKKESTHFLSPAISQITWVLLDEKGNNKDHQLFEPPLILAVDQVFARISNLRYRYLRNATLFPTEITPYEPWVIREVLHNCIAHQDYTMAGRINAVEEPDSLLFTNFGHFIPGSVEEVILRDEPPGRYRNWFLAQAMVNLNMIDTIGSGIKRMFLMQQRRSFPLPDYDLSEPEKVKVRLFGKVLDENYTRLLIEKTDLDLLDVIALDKVQKGQSLTEGEFRRLKAMRLVEGRRPNLFVSAQIAAVTGDRATYVKHRAFDKAYYKEMVTAYLEKFREAKREDIDKLLLVKLSDTLTDGQKTNFIRNLLQEMRREGTIRRIGPKKGGRWVLS